MKKWSIILLLILLFIVSASAGFLVRSFINYSKDNHKNEENMLVLADNYIRKNVQDIQKGINNGSLVLDKSGTVKTAASEIKVSPNAQVIITQKYKKCGHTRTSKDSAPREIINLNQDEVKEFYKNWSVDDFNSNEIKISRTNDGICDEHYILGESDGYISISCKNDIGEYIFKGLTDISTQYLPEDDLEKLKNGIEVVGRDNLNKVLEDYE
mgnify:FL=1